MANHSQVDHSLTAEQPWSASNISPSVITSHPVDSGEAMDCQASVIVVPETSISAGRPLNILTLGKIPEPTLLDERSLLACIVRAIPAGSGGRIRISSTVSESLKFSVGCFY